MSSPRESGLFRPVKCGRTNEGLTHPKKADRADRSVAIDMIDPRAVIRARVKKRWFDPQTAPQALEKSETGVLIADGYSIFWTLGKRDPLFVGKLSADRSAFLSALDYSKFDACNPASLSWEPQPKLAVASAQQEAADILQHAVSVNTIDLSLAARVAKRRLPGIPVFFS